jgi:hypothetical protein
MKILTIVLILSFVGITVFGFLGMNAETMHAMARCLASLIHGATCPGFGNVLAAVNFHLDAVKGFVLVTLVFAVLAIAVAILTVISSAPVFFSSNQSSLKSVSLNSSIASQRLGRWLALCEKSPTAR